MMTRDVALKLFALSAVCTISACRPTPEVGSEVKIDSGIYLTPDMQNTVPAVVSLQMIFGNSAGACTATAVSDNTVIAAAHCVHDDRRGQSASRVCISSGAYRGKCAKNVLFPQQWRNPDGNERSKWVYDIAVLVFDDGTFKNYFSVYKGNVTPGQELLLVGFSADNPESSAASKGSKRWGKNAVDGLEEGVTIISTYGNSSDRVAVSPGDSGGPIFIGCKLAGVASRMATGGAKQSYHTNLNAQATADYIATAKSSGAYICGLDGNDPAHCAASGMASVAANPPAEPGNQPGFPCSLATVGGTPDQPDQQRSPSLQPTNDIFALVLDPDDSPRLAIGAAESIGSAVMCVGGKPEECKSGAFGWQVLSKDRTKSGRVVFTSQKLTNLASSSEVIVVVVGEGDAKKYAKFRLSKN